MRAASASSDRRTGLNRFAGRFSGRTAVVTGGASGLGKAVARRIVQEGGVVCLWDLNPDTLRVAQREVGCNHVVAVDVSDHAQVAAGVQHTLRELGRIDILVNSAGITGATMPVQDFPLDSWHRTFAINVNGVFYACRETIPAMLAQGYGRIVNVASVAGKEGNPNASAYSASKAAVIGLTKSLGKELATRGILVNAIAPATFDSPILSQLPQSQVDYMRSKIPMGRLGAVDESATMICFMASEECSFTTGAVFDTSGGRMTY
ncbi:MAG: SDR family oxidoreductase [Proteobacteria bacterium]|nr:SDR family oxidoreductase [Pseudomonadota bacterium]